MDIRIQKAIHLIEHDQHQDLGLLELAAAVNVSPSHLRYLLKRETGVPLSRYRKAMKIQLAKFLLENPLLSVEEIIATLGVKDECHFMGDFKKSCGMTLAKFRETHYEIRR